MLDALRAVGVEVPALCHDPRLVSVGACRLCVVEVDGRPRAGRRVHHAAGGRHGDPHAPPAVEAQRRVLLGLLARDYPADAVAPLPGQALPPCAADPWPGRRAVRRPLAPELGTTRTPTSTWTCRSASTATAACASATRCRASSSGACGTGARRRASCPTPGPRCAESSCVSCGACVDTCPTGALEDKTVLARGAPAQWTRTTCPYCGVGCEMHVGTRDGRIVQVRPVQDAPVNKGHLCVKGRYAFDFVHVAGSRHHAADSRGRALAEASWDEALGYVAERLRRIVERHGPDSVGSARLGAGHQRGELPGAEVRPRRARHQQRRLLRARLPRAQRGGPEDDARHRRRHQLLRRHRAGADPPGVRQQRHREPPGRRARASSRPPCAGPGSSSSIPAASSWRDYADRPPAAPRPGRTCRCSTRWRGRSSTRGSSTRPSCASASTGGRPSRSSSATGRRSGPQALCGVDAELIRRAARLYATDEALDVRPRARHDRARPGHRGGDVPGQPGAAHRQPRASPARA